MARELEILVNLIKRGEGAKLAADDVRALDAATQRLEQTQQRGNLTQNQANVALARTQREVAATTRTFSILSNQTALLATSAFPQLAGSLFAVQGAMQATSQITAAQGKNFSALAVGTIGVTAALTAGVAAWNIYRNAVDENVREAIARGEGFLKLQEAVNFQLSEAEKIEMRLSGRRGIADDIRALGGRDREAGAYDDAAILQAQIERARLRQTEFEEARKREAELNSYGGAAFRGKLGGQGASEWEINAQLQAQALGEMQAKADQWYSWQLSKEEEGTDRFKKLTLERQQAWEYYTKEARVATSRLAQDIERLGTQGTELFASGLAGAIVGAFRDGEKAFQQFASNFFAMMAEMILQALILRAIQSAFGVALPGLSGGTVVAAASGGVFPRQMAAGGFAELNQATYFPDYNVVAGEAGREIMAVLARPRALEVGGVAAMVGSMEGRRVALTDADELAERGGGGIAEIVIRLEPGLLGRTEQNAIQGARVVIARDLQQDSNISRSVKALNQSP